MSKPRGVTNLAIAKRFQIGFSIKGLARFYQCEDWEIQQAIRAVMKKQKREARG